MSRVAPIDIQIWHTAAELATKDLPGLPSTKRGVQELAKRSGWTDRHDDQGVALARPRKARGGGVEYHLALLPEAAQARLMAPRTVKTVERPDRESAWMRYDRLPASMKAEATLRLAVIERVERLVRGGFPKSKAIREVVTQAAREAKAAGEAQPFQLSTLYAWFKRIEGVRADDRAAYLAPDHQGRSRTETIPEELLDLYKADYLRPAKPTHAACYGRLSRIAGDRGLTLPSPKTLQRRLEAEVDRTTQILMRGGDEELRHSVPHMTRSREALAPMQILNLDGHLWDVRVEWPDGEISRPHCLAVQDIASGKVLAVRFDQTLNQHLVRLALADTFRDFGIPQTVLMDNGRENSAKAISGGQTRWRHKVREEESAGLLKMLGIKALFATPYWGQAKPIERAFRDFAGEIAKHPAFDGAYVGRNTVEKPSDYGTSAVPIAEFERIVRSEVAVLNQRTGRRGLGMAGRSFDQVFAEGIERHGVVRATAEQLRISLAATHSLTLDGRENTIRLIGGARYWSPELGAIKRQKVIVRFDPENFAAPVHVYSLDDRYLCDAAMIEQGNFNDVVTARVQKARVRDVTRAAKDLAKAQVRLNAADVAAALPASETVGAVQEKPQPKIIRPAFGVPTRVEQAASGSTDFNAAWGRTARLQGGG